MIGLGRCFALTKPIGFLAAALLVASMVLPSAVQANSLRERFRSFTYHEAISAFMDDTTLVYHDSQFGTFAAYLAGGSKRVYVWHSASNSIITGRWNAVTMGAASPILCFFIRDMEPIFPPGDDLGLQPSPGSACYNLLPFSGNIQALLDGDPYQLNRARTVPVPLPDRRRYSPQSLMQMAGGNPASLRAAQ